MPRKEREDKISYKQFIAPVALITTGSLLLNSALNDDLQDNANRFFGENFHSNADNVLPFVPVAQIYLGKSFGFKPKNDFKQQTINIAIANLMAVSVTEILKRSVKEERPDQSDDLSFPSGHTSVAFTNAALLYYEYKDSNLWYAGSGFLFATATGILRIANNRHYTSDVLCRRRNRLGFWIDCFLLESVQVRKSWKKKKTTAFVYPQIGSQIGLGALIQLN